MKEEKHMEDSMTEQVHLLFPTHLNGAGRLFGGQLLEWIDEVSGVVARRHSESNIITAAIDNLQFKQGAYAGDTVVLVGRITHVGNSSMEVRVDTYVESLDGMRRPINRAYIVMVALDEEERPKRVPRLIVETPGQQAEWEGAEKRQRLRKRRRLEGF
ncbi:acyl-CoA thioesterase [Qiania dongpingensis]|uniref:Acyl-CoA thioesterase n=1 Tax=Qiania dongpingensis TaxID=2763669 RepID=A0A7G9G306_9FIRM|nr:acyl-CoA thioesterase [Qiania dongpingensis]QNM05188.1 acyl-CoA thioesterase [Qiania dongpingensis]